MESHDWNISKLIESYPGSDLSCGNEFRPASVLESLQQNPTWDRLQSYLSIVFDSEFKPISDSDHLDDANESISCGNHESIIESSKVLLSNVTKQMRAGFQFPFLPEHIHKIKDPLVAICRMLS